MTNLEQCKSVLADLEKASGADRSLDARIDAVLRAGTPKLRREAPWVWGNFPTWGTHEGAPGMCGVKHTDGSLGLIWDSECFTSSLDATIALVGRVLPGVSPSVGQNIHHKTWHAYLQILGDDGEPLIIGRFASEAPTPPLALLTALFRALIARMEKADG